MQKEKKTAGTQSVYIVPFYTIFSSPPPPKRPKKLQLQVFKILRAGRTRVHIVGVLCKAEDDVRGPTN